MLNLIRTSSFCLSVLIVSSCAHPVATSQPQNCYSVGPIRTKYGVGIQIPRGMKLTLNFCFNPEAPPLSLEDCIKKGVNFTTSEGKTIVFEEQDVISACNEAIKRGPEMKNR